MLFTSPSKFCLRQFFTFLTSEAHLFVFQVGSHSVVVVQTRNGSFVISWERALTLLILEVFRHYHSWTEPFRRRASSLWVRWTYKAQSFSKRSILQLERAHDETLIPRPLSTLGTPGFLHHCFPVFCNINLRMPDSFGMLFTAVMKFQGKLASLSKFK